MVIGWEPYWTGLDARGSVMLAKQVRDEVEGMSPEH